MEKPDLPSIPQDPIELRQRSMELENDPALRQHLAEAGRQKVSEEYNWTRQEETLVEFYRDLVEA